MIHPMLIIAAALALATAPQPPREADVVGPRLAQVRSFAKLQGEQLWPGYGAAPFDLLLIGRDSETLLCRDEVPKGFMSDGRDPATGCARSIRPKSALPAGLLAAMPLFGPPATIVMGTPESTGRTPADWTRTILHEHFHQWQYALPDYYTRVDALGLTDGDETGMWMLNFPFPYDDARLREDYAAASRALSKTLEARGKSGFLAAFDHFLEAREAFEKQAGAKNWRYLELQLWQEGVARWTEIELGRVHPDATVRAEAAALEIRTLERLRNPDLAQQRRELAYPFGTGQAWLLDACGSDWRKEYPRVLALGSLLKAARAGCGRR